MVVVSTIWHRNTSLLQSQVNRNQIYTPPQKLNTEQNIWNNGFQDTENQATKSSDSWEVKDKGGELCYWPNLLPWQFLRRSLGDSWSWGRGVRVWGGPGPSVFRTGTREERTPESCTGSLLSVQLSSDQCTYMRTCVRRGKTPPKGLEVMVPSSHRAGNRAHTGKRRDLWDIGYSTQRVLPQ